MFPPDSTLYAMLSYFPYRHEIDQSSDLTLDMKANKCNLKEKELIFSPFYLLFVTV